jgi:hypothetical protein
MFIRTFSSVYGGLSSRYGASAKETDVSMLYLAQPEQQQQLEWLDGGGHRVWRARR